jgi:hypothetical protein
MHSQFLGVARAPSACRSQLENTSPLLPAPCGDFILYIITCYHNTAGALAALAQGRRLDSYVRGVFVSTKHHVF